MTLNVQTHRDPVREYWEVAPCGTGEFPWGTIQGLSRQHRERRYRLEPHIPPFAGFSEARGKRVLEIGFGAGTDLLEFARCGATVAGIDLTEAARVLTLQRAEAEGLSTPKPASPPESPIPLFHNCEIVENTMDLRVGSAEALPWPDATFDLVYSFGVIHHAAHPESVVAEVSRVLKPGGTFKAMLYNRRSLNALLYWLRFGLARGRPFASLGEILVKHLESPGTRAYTVGEIRRLLGGFDRVSVQTVVTVFDLRLGRRRFLPLWTHRLVPGRWGWNHLVTAYKPAPPVPNSTFSQLRKSGIA